MTSAESLEKFFGQVKQEVADRESAYGTSWEQEELVWMFQNIRRKSKSVDLMWNNGNHTKDVPKFLEQLRDLSAYCGFLHLRIEEKKEEKCE